MTGALETTGLSKRFGRTWALRECTLQVPAGSITALVGPNGAGKTTLLSLAVGLLRPTDGSVRVFDADPLTRPEVLGRTGFVAQDTPLYRDFTGDDLLAMGRRLNARWDERIARDRLAELAIPIARKVGALSSGQRAQVALAMVLAKRPDLLLLDEPVVSLDPLARREFLKTLMSGVAEEGTTVVLSSHLLSDLERLCDHLIVMSGARVQVLGSVEDLLARHVMLTGPRVEDRVFDALGTVVHRTDAGRQTRVLVRTTGDVVDPRWDAQPVTLEDLVLAYLQQPSVGALPGPRAAEAGGPA